MSVNAVNLPWGKESGVAQLVLGVLRYHELVARVATKPTPAVLSQPDALVVLVTIETLLFAALSIILTLNDVKDRVPDLPLRAHELGYCAVALIGIVGLGAVTAWAALFGSRWPGGFTRGAEGLAILVGIVVQPVAAWALARGLDSKP